ncbi:nucleotidyl transferase AbiEii/AbiGii toxin family protein [Nocardia thailandica]|uniref:Nucleotidyl transferase AbiEii/AbiGii toxin family protein n=1 Tax=Nocardia thailandica TaxID=257275 RepID=A0ABW6PXT8_9NOCA
MRTPDAVRRSITDHLQNLAKQTGQEFNSVLRKFVMSRFLERVFAVDPNCWILKGGVGMMVRLPESRFSRDIDLLAVPDPNLPEGDPITQLRNAVRDHNVDHLRFEVGEPSPLSNGKGSSVPVSVLLGGRVFDKFSIDVVDGRRDLVGAVEHHPVPRLIVTEDFPGQARVALYPLADQVADKLCAMFERFGQRGATSGRYRDLVDLLLVSTYLPIDLASTVEAVEAERVLRGIAVLPETMQAPGQDWVQNWPGTAKKSPLADEHHELEAALATARLCYDRVLASVPAIAATASWDPDQRQWTP